MPGKWDRRTFLAATSAVGASPWLAAPALGQARRRPNILLVVSDQERNPSLLPDDFVRPHFDGLRARGLSLVHYSTPTAPCGPARAVLYTGHHSQRNGIVANPGSGQTADLSPAVRTMGHRFRSAGYRTFYKGKWHLSAIAAGRRGATYQSSADALEPYGFSAFNYSGDPTGYAWTGLREDPAIAADAANLLGQLAADDRPWLLAVNFVNPHDIMFFDATGKQGQTRAQPNLISPMKPAPPLPPFDRQWNFALPNSFGKDDLRGKPATQMLEREYLDLIYGHMPPENVAAWQAFQDYYLNCLLHLDASLGVLLAALKHGGLDENLIIAYTSDHGERGGAHGLRQKGGDMYRENLGVPLVLVHPDGARGEVSTALGSHIDLLPTLLDLAGAEKEASDLPGVSLAPLVADAGARTARDASGILFNYEVNMRWSMGETRARLLGQPVPADAGPDRVLLRGIQVGQHKFARYFRPGEHHRPGDLASLAANNDLELYDLAADPDEMINLAYRGGSGPLLATLNARLNALIAREIGDDDGAVFRTMPNAARRDR